MYDSKKRKQCLYLTEEEWLWMWPRDALLRYANSAFERGRLCRVIAASFYVNTSLRVERNKFGVLIEHIYCYYLTLICSEQVYDTRSMMHMVKSVQKHF
jgi:hypothetical protein